MHNGEPKDEVLGHDDTGPSRDRRAAAGGHAVAAARGKKGTQDFDFNLKFKTEESIYPKGKIWLEKDPSYLHRGTTWELKIYA